MELHEPAVAYHKLKMTVEEYLAFENEAEEKHEYYQGEVFAMSGAKATHNEIALNTIFEIKQFFIKDSTPFCKFMSHRCQNGLCETSSDSGERRPSNYQNLAKSMS